MSDEMTRKEILDLVARGKLTVDEAASLLAPATAVPPAADMPEKTPEMVEPVIEPVIEKEKEPAVAPFVPQEGKPGDPPRWLRVRVRDLQSGRNKVTVNVPLGIVKFGLGMAGRFNVHNEDIDMDEIGRMIVNAERGIIVDVQDEEDNEHVQIYLD